MMTSSPPLPLVLVPLVILLTSVSSSLQPPDDAAEQAFLDILGLPHKPAHRPPTYIPQRLKDLYEELNHLEPGTFDKEIRVGRQSRSASSAVHLPGNTVRTFYFQDDHEEDRDAHSRHFVFDVAALPSSETLHRAELHVLRDTPSANSSSSRATMRLSVYQVLSKGHEVMVDTKLIHPTSSKGGKWHTLDVTDAVKQWQTSPGMNHGLRVEVLGDSPGHTRLRRSADITPDEWQTQQPMVMTYTDDRDVETQKLEQEKHSHRHRRRRSEARTRRSKKNRRRRRKRICRRHSLLVDFEEVGWNSWIVAPPSFDAYYCHGECPFALSDNLNTTNHAVVQSLVHSMDPEAVPKPCCVPTQLSPFSLLYVNTNGSLVLKAYKDMVVEACGCR